LLYHSLVIVFENPQRSKLSLYLFAYGSSLIVVGTTFGIAYTSFSFKVYIVYFDCENIWMNINIFCL